MKKLITICATCVLLTSSLSASVVTNGDFSDGLNDWSATSNVTDGGGYALLSETVSFNEYLTQTVTIPVGSTSLSFDYAFSGYAGTSAGAYMVAELVDTTGSWEPILDDNSWGGWAFFCENAPGYSPPQFDYNYSASNVSLTEGTGTLGGATSNTVTLDLTSLTLPRDNVMIRFMLYNDDGTDYSGTLAVDNVSIIPEPATMCLLSLGALGLIRRRRKA